MPKNNPNNTKLSEKDIIDALGNSLLVTARKSFASGLIVELEKVFAANGAAFPEKKVVNKLDENIQSLLHHLGVVERLIHKDPFAGAIVQVCIRAVAKKGYKADVVDIRVLLETLKKSIKHVRFQNAKRGPDVRLANEITLIIARRYKSAFGSIPGIAGMDIRGDGHDNSSPFQRVCKIVAKTKKIKGIGKTTQKQVCQMLKEGRPSPLPYFRPDVTFLPEKNRN